MVEHYLCQARCNHLQQEISTILHKKNLNLLKNIGGLFKRINLLFTHSRLFLAVDKLQYKKEKTDIHLVKFNLKKKLI